MDIKNKLHQVDLIPKNSIVIGSGILNALNIRISKDIDVVVTEEKYKQLSAHPRFKKEHKHNRETLTDGLFEIMTNWTVMKKNWSYHNLLPYSIIINGIQYITIEFLFNAKQSWLADGSIRQKDIDDIKLMKGYLSKNKLSPT